MQAGDIIRGSGQCEAAEGGEGNGMKYRYHCWNSECEAYCGYGYLIRSRTRLEFCPYCGFGPLEELTDLPPGWTYVLAFFVGGAFFGMAIGSWVALTIGMTAGLIVGLMFKPEEG